MHVITENVVDLESDQKVFACKVRLVPSAGHQILTAIQVTCSDTNAMPAWEKFLSDCDRLTRLTLQKGRTSTHFLEKEIDSGQTSY
jgi:hypothetical protein